MTKEVAVIDDECDIAEIVKMALEQAGYKAVSLCQDTSSALEFIKEARPDLVMLDLRMPQISGWAVLQQIRSDAETSHTPVMLTTGMPGDTVQVSSEPKGGKTELLLKPFDLDDLIRKVEQIIGKP